MTKWEVHILYKIQKLVVKEIEAETEADACRLAEAWSINGEPLDEEVAHIQSQIEIDFITRSEE